jgi:hypothetical protein
MRALSLSSLLRTSAFCIAIAISAIGQPSFAEPPHDPRPEGQFLWVSKAQELIRELDNMTKSAPEMDEPRLFSDEAMIKAARSQFAGQRLANLRKLDNILWNLWLVTGMPPEIRGLNKSLRTYAEENASAYRKYLGDHADLTEEELQRLGLKNAAKSLGSPFWYMTMKYLNEKAGIEFNPKAIIRVEPSHFLVEIPLSPDSYIHLSDAILHWLDVNKNRIRWDSDKKRFYPSKGEYLGNEELSRAIQENNRHIRIEDL